MKIDKIYFVMPAYNESANIEEVVDLWLGIVEKIGGESRLVVANDGSKDDTWEKLDQMQQEKPLLIALDKPNSGHGSTVLYLYRYAISQGADFIFQTDSDGQTNPDEFWQMYDNRNQYDFQIGHRIGRQDGWSRVVVTKILRLVVWLLFHEWVLDANTPFRLMRSERLKAIIEKIPKDYFLCNVAITAIAVKWKESIQWYPITFRPRMKGVNSINLKRIVKIGWRALSDFRKINNGLKCKE